MRGVERIVSGQSIGLVLAGVAAFAGAFWFGLPKGQQSGRPASRETEVANLGAHQVGLTSETFPGMVRIPGGEFVMGNDGAGAWPDEKPAKQGKFHLFL